MVERIQATILHRNREKKIHQAKKWTEANRERRNENRRINYRKKKNLNIIYSNDSTSSKC